MIGTNQKAKQKKNRALKTTSVPNRNRNREKQLCREQTGAEAGEGQLRVGETGGASVLGPSSQPGLLVTLEAYLFMVQVLVQVTQGQGPRGQQWGVVETGGASFLGPSSSLQGLMGP